MLTRKQALEKVRSRVNQADPAWPQGPVIMVLDEYTIEKPWGWVYFYESAEYLQTGDPGSQLAGNAPYIVNKETGELQETGTALPIEDYVDEYERKIATGT